MSLPEPAEKIADAATPGVGAITPFSFSADGLAGVLAGPAAPKSFAIAARSTGPSSSLTSATGAGATNTHVQCASW